MEHARYQGLGNRAIALSPKFSNICLIVAIVGLGQAWAINFALGPLSEGRV